MAGDLVLGLGPGGRGWAYALQGGTFSPAQAPGLYGWLRTLWSGYLDGEAPTFPTILN